MNSSLDERKFIALPAQAVRGALTCGAEHDEPRYYLVGICLDNRGDVPRLVGTNGYILFRHENNNIAELIEPGNAVILSKFTVPKNAETVIIEITDLGWKVSFLGGYPTPAILVDEVDAKYPDHSAAMKLPEKHSLEGGEIGVNLKYIEKVKHAFTSTSVIMSFDGTKNGILIKAKNDPSTEIYLMPMDLLN